MLFKFRRMLVDVLIAAVAFATAYTLPILSGPLEGPVTATASAILSGTAIYAVLAGMLSYIFGTYKTSWRFASVVDVLNLVRVTSIVALLYLAFSFVITRASGFPRSTFFLAWSFHLGGLAGVRLFRRAIVERSLVNGLLLARPHRPRTAKPAIIVGLPEAADSFLRDLQLNGRFQYFPLGVVVTVDGWNDHSLRGVQVIGRPSDFPAILKRYAHLSGPKAAIILDGQNQGGDQLDTEQLGQLRAAGFELLRKPKISEFTEVDQQPALLRPLKFEELLFRQPAFSDVTEPRLFLRGKRVLITGAGGSIGSELCRQVASMGCASIALLDFSEFNLFQIDREIAHSFPSLERSAIICNVRDYDQVFVSTKLSHPNIIFHAAALKHVSIVECNPGQGVLTNVLGTANVMSAAKILGVEHAILISTDKAVAPNNVMGATKRLAENFVRHAAACVKPDAGTKFNIVRFGNVLGSAGSVVPIFRSQIERGGPITITHPDVERFFMTIPEAVQLILQASARGAKRKNCFADLFVLDMGKPVRILDLAHQMIQLHNLKPNVDIKIEYIGLHPGEKLTEELVDVGEEASLPDEVGIIEVKSNPASLLTLEQVNELTKAALEEGDEALRARVYAALMN